MFVRDGLEGGFYLIWMRWLDMLMRVIRICFWKRVESKEDRRIHKESIVINRKGI